MQGTSQALEECEWPERMKEGRNGVRCRQPPGWGTAAGRGRKRVGVRRGCGGPSAAGGKGRAVGSAPPLGGGPPPSREAGKQEAALLAEWRGRREAPDGLRAPPAGCGGSRSQSGARAQTSGRQRTPASGPQGRGGSGARRGGAGRLRPPGRRATWAEAPPPPGAGPPRVGSAVLLRPAAGERGPLQTALRELQRRRF